MASGRFEQNHNSTRDVIQTPDTVGNLAPLNDYLVDIQVSNNKVVGRARGGSHLGFWRHGVDNYTAKVLNRDGMVMDARESEDYSDMSRLTEIKSAAVRADDDVPPDNRHLYLGEGGVIRVKMEN